jgi:hypothetical protein
MKMIDGAASRACLEEVAHARGTHADDHLDELRGAQAEKGDAGLAGDRSGEEGLPRTGRTDEQHALRHGAAEPLVLRGVLQEVDELDELVLGVIDARDVVEGDLPLRLAIALGAAAPETEQPASAGHRALIQPNERPDQEERGAEPEQEVLKERPTVERSRVDEHALRLQQRLEAGIGEGGQQCLEAQCGAGVRPFVRIRHLLFEGALDRITLARSRPRRCPPESAP